LHEDEDEASSKCVIETQAAGSPSDEWPPRCDANFDASTESTAFPSISELLQDKVFTDYISLLPAPLLVVPQVPHGRSHRIRLRWKRRRDIILHANVILRAFNKLDAGLRTSRAQRRSIHPGRSAATTSLHKRVFGMAASFALARQDPDIRSLTGAQATARLLKLDRVDRYSFSGKTHAQVPMIANALDEPTPQWPVVDMLTALPWDEAQYYSDESNVLEYEGKSNTLFRELQTTFGFVGGEYSQYVAYFNRDDVDPDLWSWALEDQVRCVAGFGVVPKKDPTRQRKLLMTCAANYLWGSAKHRSELGMVGGGGLAHIYAPEGAAFVAGWDQSNAFTSVRTPSWFWPWMAVPPLRATDVWHKIPAMMKRGLSPMAYVLVGSISWSTPATLRRPRSRQFLPRTNSSPSSAELVDGGANYTSARWAHRP